MNLTEQVFEFPTVCVLLIFSFNFPFISPIVGRPIDMHNIQEVTTIINQGPEEIWAGTSSGKVIIVHKQVCRKVFSGMHYFLIALNCRHVKSST